MVMFSILIGVFGLVAKAHIDYMEAVDKVIKNADPNTVEGRSQLQAVNESLERMTSSNTKSSEPKMQGDSYIELKALKILP
jgi:hypothetical protein